MAAATRRAHLGGFIPGGDPATWYPALWDWLIDEVGGVHSVLDVGCGEGLALDYFRERGCFVTGIDGVASADPDIVEHDYAEGPWEYERGRPYIEMRYDLGWSCEFVEHVEERFLPNFLPDFDRCELLLMTHADPGQFGHHHVNCRTAEYWRGALAAIGYSFDAELTARARVLAGKNPDPLNHFVRSGLAFRKA